MESSRTVLLADLRSGASWTVAAEATESIEPVHDQNGKAAGRLVRQRWAVAATVGGPARARRWPVSAQRVHRQSGDSRWAGWQGRRGTSFAARHAHDHRVSRSAGSVRLSDRSARLCPEAAQQCTQHRCWPVLAGEPGEASAVLGSPIILYDYPEIAGESTGSLFDAPRSTKSSCCGCSR